MKNIKTSMLPACYFPTKVILIDDNQQFLDSVNLHLDPSMATYQFYNSPLSALDFLNSYKADPFTSRCILQEEDHEFDHRSIDVDISKIHKEIYNMNRFNQLSVLVVDYTMPGMTGAELIHRLDGANFKVILLTGEANSSHAVQLFNDGSIHYFIRKDDFNAITLLKSAIKRLQMEYMCQLSQPIIQSIIQKSGQAPHSCLSDTVFIDFFYALLKKHHLNEFYLYDEFGSFLLIDQDEKISWLLVLDENEMEATSFEMSEKDVRINPQLLSDIKNHRVLRYCFNPEEYPQPADIKKGKTLFYPATKIEGKTNYYYCYTGQPFMQPKINFKDIAYFSDYRNSLK